MSDPSFTDKLAFVESPSSGLVSRERLDAIRAKMWLRAMLDQGEDRIWRGAEQALRYVIQTELARDDLFDALLELHEAVRLDADGEMGISGQLSEALAEAQRKLERSVVAP